MKILIKTYKTVDVKKLLKKKNMTLCKLAYLTGIDQGLLCRLINEQRIAHEGHWKLIQEALESGKEVY